MTLESKLERLMSVQNELFQTKRQAAEKGLQTTAQEIAQKIEENAPIFIGLLLEPEVIKDPSQVSITDEGLELIISFFSKLRLPNAKEITGVGEVLRNSNINLVASDHSSLQTALDLTDPQNWLLTDGQRQWFSTVSQASALKSFDEIEQEKQQKIETARRVFMQPPPARKALSGMRVVDAETHRRGVKSPKRTTPKKPGIIARVIYPSARRQVKHGLYDIDKPIKPETSSSSSVLGTTETLRVKKDFFDANPRVPPHIKRQSVPSPNYILGIAQQEAEARLAIDRELRESEVSSSAGDIAVKGSIK